MADTHRIVVSGSTVTGSAVGNQHVSVTNVHAGEPMTVDRLRALLAAAADEVVALGGDEAQRARLRAGVEQVEDELRAERPDADVVRGGWKRVLRLLDGTAAASESVQRIWQAVTAVFPS